MTTDDQERRTLDDPDPPQLGYAMSRPQWRDVHEDWVDYGAFPSVVFDGGDETVDWGKVVDAIQAQRGWQHTFEVDSVGREAPRHADEMLGLARTHDLVVWRVVPRRGILVIGRVDDVGIEFDFDEREIRRQEHLDVVCDFVALVGYAAGRRVEVSLDGAEPLLCFDPQTGSIVRGRCSQY